MKTPEIIKREGEKKGEREKGRAEEGRRPNLETPEIMPRGYTAFTSADSGVCMWQTERAQLAEGVGSGSGSGGVKRVWERIIKKKICTG